MGWAGRWQPNPRSRRRISDRASAPPPGGPAVADREVQDQPCAPLSAQEPANPAQKAIVEKIDLQDGDTLVFLGDSITHQCLYTQYVEDYFYARYPKLRLIFHNAGVGGDRAKNALDRFDEDVAAFKPKYVTILLGMNKIRAAGRSYGVPPGRTRRQGARRRGLGMVG